MVALSDLLAGDSSPGAAFRADKPWLTDTSGTGVPFQLRKPRDLLRAASPPPFDYGDVPVPVADLGYHYSEATGFDRSGVIVAAMVAAASVIDDRYKLLVNRGTDWKESARLWAVLIGSPSAGKSPSMRAATDHIKTMHGRMVEGWRQQYAKDDDPPPMPALYTSDATIAALTERLKSNPQGLLMLTEEFASWIGGIDSTDRGEAASNRGHWLQLYDGGQHQIDRIGRGSFLVPNWSASVLAACAPDGLRSLSKHLTNDGLIHRFIPVMMGSPNYDANGDAQQALARWQQWLEYVHHRGWSQSGCVVELSPEADELFRSENRAQRLLADATYEFSPALASHLGKHGGIMARVALVAHVLSDDKSSVLKPQAMATAIAFTQKVRKHAAAMFDGVLTTSPALNLARALGRSIVAEGMLKNSIGRDWMTQHCADFRKADDRLRREAVQLLEDADWLQALPGARQYGGWTTRWETNEMLDHMFAEEGAVWRARRAAVREAIGGEDTE
jgi:hypothetical protein